MPIVGVFVWVKFSNQTNKKTVPEFGTEFFPWEPFPAEAPPPVSAEHLFGPLWPGRRYCHCGTCRPLAGGRHQTPTIRNPLDFTLHQSNDNQSRGPTTPNPSKNCDHLKTLSEGGKTKILKSDPKVVRGYYNGGYWQLLVPGRHWRWHLSRNASGWEEWQRPPSEK